jgi:nucleoside-diphosphate-sugar epimerase
LAAGQPVLVIGATGASGRIATQLAERHGARVVAAGRNQHILDDLAAGGADAAIRVDRPPEELTAVLADLGPYDLIIDYLWGAPAEVVFAALVRTSRHTEDAPRRTRYILVGMTAGEVAALPAMTLRAARVQLVGSVAGGPAASPRRRLLMTICSSRCRRRDPPRYRPRAACRHREDLATSRQRSAQRLRALIVAGGKVVVVSGAERPPLGSVTRRHDGRRCPA